MLLFYETVKVDNIQIVTYKIETLNTDKKQFSIC